jgi:hypothetical protein
MPNLKQPLLGLVASLFVVAVSLTFISLFSFPTFTNWIANILQCFIPAQIMVGILWKCDYPKSARRQRQPLKGLLLIGITIAAGAIAGPVYFLTLGGGITPPAPMLTQAIIGSITIMFWLAIMWGGWPFNKLIPNPVGAGIATLAGAYLLNAILFRLLFNYEFMQDAPVYVASLDPHGPFNAWSVLNVYIAALAVMFLMLQLDLWPLSRTAALMKQPVLGLVWTTVALAFGGMLFEFATQVVQMDPVKFLVHVPIPFIFGTIIVQNMLQNSIFERLSQPLKGFANAAASLVVGQLLAVLFSALAPVIAGPLVSGSPTYEFEIWLASSLLAVTFPFLIYYSEFFRFWPLRTD